MAAPTNRCPFKSNAGTGITCENTNCMAYDSTNETCKILQYIESELKDAKATLALLAAAINN